MGAMQMETNNPAHFGEFIRLNELWITEHFSIEEADRALAANPARVIAEGGAIFSLLDGEKLYTLKSSAFAPFSKSLLNAINWHAWRSLPQRAARVTAIAYSNTRWRTRKHSALQASSCFQIRFCKRPLRYTKNMVSSPFTRGHTRNTLAVTSLWNVPSE